MKLSDEQMIASLALPGTNVRLYPRPCVDSTCNRDARNLRFVSDVNAPEESRLVNMRWDSQHAAVAEPEACHSHLAPWGERGTQKGFYSKEKG